MSTDPSIRHPTLSLHPQQGNDMVILIRIGCSFHALLFLGKTFHYFLQVSIQYFTVFEFPWTTVSLLGRIFFKFRQRI